MTKGKNIHLECRDINLNLLSGDNFLIHGTGIKRNNIRVNLIGGFKSSSSDGEFLDEEKIYHIIKRRLSKTKEI